MTVKGKICIVGSTYRFSLLAYHLLTTYHSPLTTHHSQLTTYCCRAFLSRASTSFSSSFAEVLSGELLSLDDLEGLFVLFSGDGVLGMAAARARRA